MSNKITITEALSELKLLQKRIDKKIDSTLTPNNTIIDYKIGNSETGIRGFRNLETMTKDSKSFMDSITDLLKNRNILKSRIAQSNAITEVKIGKRTLTIVEAIEYKNSILYEKELVSNLRTVYDGVLRSYKAEAFKANNTVESLLNSKMSSDSNKEVNSKNLANDLLSIYEPKLMDPLDIKNIIEEFENKIEEFENNVDIVLNISNATTFIDF